MQALALVLPMGATLVLGYIVLLLGVWVAYGDSPIHPLHADRAVNWLIATYISIGVLCGLGVHAAVIRNPKLFFVSLAITAAVMSGMVWAYRNLS